METLHLIKIKNGFTISEREDITYFFEPFVIDEEGTMVSSKLLNDTMGLFGTDKCIIFLTTDCYIDGLKFSSIQEFSDELYRQII
jgi:hypothetical protein